MYTSMKIIDVKYVAGDTICKFWSSPMVIIETSDGKFLDYGSNIKQWRDVIGKSVHVITEACRRRPKHTWLHLESTS